MKCEEVMEMMQRFLDEDLTETEIAAMHEHMKTCASCAEMFERLTHLSEELVNLPKIAPPYSIVDAILPKLQELDEQASAEQLPPAAVSPARRRGSTRSFAYRVIGGAAAAVLFIVIAVNQLPRFTSDSTANDASLSGGEQSAAPQGDSGDMMIMMNSIASDEAPASGHGSSEPSLEKQASGGSGSPAMDRSPEGQERMGVKDFGGREETPPNEGGRADVSGWLPPEDDAGIIRENSPDDLSDFRTEEGLDITLSDGVEHAAYVMSPDRAYSAFAEATEEGYQIVIIDAGGDRIYASPAKQVEEVRNLRWSEGGETLVYEAVTDDAAVTFTIDVRTRSEARQ